MEFKTLLKSSRFYFKLKSPISIVHTILSWRYIYILLWNCVVTKIIKSGIQTTSQIPYGLMAVYLANSKWNNTLYAKNLINPYDCS